MQNSKVTVTKNGKETTKELKVLRTFQDASGTLIHLLQGGDYGYRDGSPVRTEAEFNMIGDPIQRESAISWFRRRGKTMAEKYYGALEAARRKKLGDQQDEAPASDTTMDQVLYFKTPADGPPIDLKTETPVSWMEAFQKRPDWWGVAESIRFADWLYTRFRPNEPAETDAGGTGESKPRKTGPQGEGKAPETKKDKKDPTGDQSPLDRQMDIPPTASPGSPDSAAGDNDWEE